MAPPEFPAIAPGNQHDSTNSPVVYRRSLQQASSFISLPDEIKLKVFRCLLVSDSVLEMLSVYPYPTFLCQLSSQALRVCRHFYLMGRQLLYGSNVFKIRSSGEFYMTAFLMAIGSANQELIRYLAIGLPYKQSPACHQRGSCLAQLLKRIHSLEIDFNGFNVHLVKGDITEPFYYKSALSPLKGLATCCENLIRLIRLPPPTGSPLSLRFKLVSSGYTLRRGETDIDIRSGAEKLEAVA